MPTDEIVRHLRLLAADFRELGPHLAAADRLTAAADELERLALIEAGVNRALTQLESDYRLRRHGGIAQSNAITAIREAMSP